MPDNNDELRWRDPVAEECDAGRWLVWWTDCWRYRVARFESKHDDRVVYKAGLGKDVIIGEYKTLARAVEKCEVRHCNTYNLVAVYTNARAIIQKHAVEFPDQGVDVPAVNDHNVNVAGQTTSPFLISEGKMKVQKDTAVTLLLKLGYKNVKKELKDVPEVVRTRLVNMPAIWDESTEDEQQAIEFTADERALLDALLARKDGDEVELVDAAPAAAKAKGGNKTKAAQAPNKDNEKKETPVATATKTKGKKGGKAQGSKTKVKATAAAKAKPSANGNGHVKPGRDFLGAREGTKNAAINAVLKAAKGKGLTLREILDKAEITVPDGCWHYLRAQVNKGKVKRSSDDRNPTYTLA